MGYSMYSTVKEPGRSLKVALRFIHETTQTAVVFGESPGDDRLVYKESQKGSRHSGDDE